MAPNGNNGGDTDQEHYDTHEYAGDQATTNYQMMLRMPEADRGTYVDLQSAYTNNLATTLAPEVVMGEDRVISDTPNWYGYTSQQLYDAATQGNSPTTADTLGRTFTDGGNRLAEAANALFEAVTALEGAWSGEAADSAKAALAPLAAAAGNAGQTAQMMGVQMSRQSVAATEVRKLPPPQEFDQQQALQAMVTGGPAAMQTDLREQREAANEVKREQISYLEAYTQTMTSVDEQTPSFVPPQTKLIRPDNGANPVITANPVVVPDSGTALVGGTSTGDPTGRYLGAAPAAGSGEYGSDQNGGLDTSDLTLPGTLPGTGTSTAGYTPTAPPTTTTAPTSLGLPGGHPGSAPTAGSGGFGGAFGNFAPASSSTPGTATTSGGAPGTGPRGLGPVPTAVTGRGGAGGMGVGGRRAEDEDDDERNRPSFLLEGDPDSAFGSDALAAPPVIGGDGED